MFLSEGDLISKKDLMKQAFSVYYPLEGENYIKVIRLEDVEKAPTEPRWISVAEKLPEEFEYVLCSTDAREIFMANYLGKMNDGTDCFDDDNGMMWEGDVIAWMPLPEPYKECDEDDK